MTPRFRDVRIRAYEDRDAGALALLFVRSVRELGRRHYSAEQVEAWAAEAASVEETHARCTDGRIVLIAVDDADCPVAYVDLERNGHIDMLFCLPEAAGKGIASALLLAVETSARELGIGHLFVEASEAARPLFERRGFAAKARREFTIGGAMIHNYAMERTL